MSTRARLLEGERALEDSLADVSATIRLILDCVRLLEDSVAVPAQRAQLQEAQKNLVLAASALDIAGLIDGGAPSDDLETLP